MLGVIETRWEEKLRWHVEALERANRVGDEQVREFYPSLYVSLGYVHGNLGQMDQALDYYEKARAHEAVLANDEYGSLVRHAIARGLEQVRLGQAPTRDW
jgi:tetratricopeptide (TPR) repeat protein